MSDTRQKVYLTVTTECRDTETRDATYFTKFLQTTFCAHIYNSMLCMSMGCAYSLNKISWGAKCPVTYISVTILLTFENGCSVSSSLRLLNGDSRISPSAFFPS